MWIKVYNWEEIFDELLSDADTLIIVPDEKEQSGNELIHVAHKTTILDNGSW